MKHTPEYKKMKKNLKMANKNFTCEAKNMKRYNFSDFDHGEKIGDGGLSVVSLATEKQTGKIFALKRYRIEASDYNLIDEDFIKEIIYLNLLNSHYFVKLYGFILNNDNRIYLVFEKLNQFTLTNVKTHFKQLIECVYYMHSFGIMHNDLKIDNIMIDENGNVKIIDLGNSTLQLFPKMIKNMNKFDSTDYIKAYDENKVINFYKNNEHISMQSSNVCNTTDIYSLGVTIVNLILDKICEKFVFFNDEIYHVVENESSKENELSNKEIEKESSEEKYSISKLSDEEINKIKNYNTDNINFYEIVCKMLEFDSKKRLSAKNILDILNGISTIENVFKYNNNKNTIDNQHMIYDNYILYDRYMLYDRYTHFTKHEIKNKMNDFQYVEEIKNNYNSTIQTTCVNSYVLFLIYNYDVFTKDYHFDAIIGSILKVKKLSRKTTTKKDIIHMFLSYIYIFHTLYVYNVEETTKHFTNVYIDNYLTEEDKKCKYLKKEFISSSSNFIINDILTIEPTPILFFVEYVTIKYGDNDKNVWNFILNCATKYFICRRVDEEIKIYDLCCIFFNYYVEKNNTYSYILPKHDKYQDIILFLKEDLQYEEMFDCETIEKISVEL